MKKFLLSVIAAAACATVSAADYTVDFKDAADIDGTFVEETLKEDGSLQAAPHYQPVASLKCADFTFAVAKGAGSNDPAFYMTPSTNANTMPTLRIYNGNTLTITAPAGVKMGKIEFALAKGTKDAQFTATAGSVYDVTTTAMTWSNSEAVETVTLTAPGTFQIKSMVVSTDAAAAPVVETATFGKTTTVANGLYLFAVNQDGTVKMALPAAEGLTYGRMGLGSTISGNAVEAPTSQAFELAVADGKCTIKDAYGRYYAMDDSHLTSFQFYTELNEGCYWTYAVEGDCVKFTNALQPTCIISQTKGDTSWYTNLAPAAAPAEFNLPMLFVAGDYEPGVDPEPGTDPDPVTGDTFNVDFQNATDINGTFVEETLKEDGTLQAAPHYQPVNSLKCAGFTFVAAKGAGSNDPAFYMTPSTNANTMPTLRIYKDNTLTITAPAGVKMGKIEFTLAKGVKDAQFTASAGAVYDVTTTAMTWSNSEAVETVTLTAPGTFQIKSMVISTATADTPVIVTYAYTKTTNVATGSYVFAVNEEGTVKMALPAAEGLTYGRMGLGATIAGDVVEASLDQAFDIAVADGKCTIKDAYGRYYAMDETHNTSFQFYTELNEGCYWTFAAEGDCVKFTNALQPTCIISQTKGTSSWYTNLAPAAAPAEFNLPVLFAADPAGVQAVAAEEVNAPVEFYNLQGVRVAEAANGIFIRRQGNKVTKVAL